MFEDDPKAALIKLLCDKQRELDEAAAHDMARPNEHGRGRRSDQNSLRKKSNKDVVASGAGLMPDDRQEIVNSYFSMYDLNQSGYIDTREEIKQLTSAVLFKFKHRVRSKELNEHLDDIEGASFTCQQYSAWFAQTYLAGEGG